MCNCLNFITMKIERVDIGSVVRELVEKSNMSKAEFAKTVGIARQNIEKTVFQKASLDTDLLCRISEVLDCNLFDYYRDKSLCNTKDYEKPKEVKAVLTIEMGSEKQEQVMKFVFGNHNIEILNK